MLDRAKSDFLRLIHHELRSPLNGLLGVGELALDELGASEEGAELREMFELSRQRMLTILDDALLLTEIEVASDNFSSEGHRSGIHSSFRHRRRRRVCPIAWSAYRIGAGRCRAAWSPSGTCC